jgi:hypothetical protein
MKIDEPRRVKIYEIDDGITPNIIKQNFFNFLKGTRYSLFIHREINNKLNFFKETPLPTIEYL